MWSMGCLPIRVKKVYGLSAHKGKNGLRAINLPFPLDT